MVRYQCSICQNEVESKNVPDFCSGCGSSYSAWTNLDTGKLETAAIPEKEKHSIKLTRRLKKKIVKPKKTTPLSPIKSYSPPPVSSYAPPPPITTYVPPPYSPGRISGFKLFIEELKYAFNDIVGDLKINIKWIFLLSIIVFVFLELISGFKFGTYISLFLIATSIFVFTIYYRAVKTSSIGSLYSKYKRIGKVITVLMLFSTFSLLQNTLFVNNSFPVQENKTADFNKDVTENYNATENPNNSSLDKPTPDNNDRSPKRIEFTPIVDLQKFVQQDEETDFIENINIFFRRLFKGTALDLSGIYYAKNILILRSSPSINSRINSKIYPGEKIEFLDEKDGDYLKARSGSYTGWLINKDSYYSKSPYLVKCIISVNSANIRSGPGTNFSKIGKAKTNDIFRFIETNTNKTWCKIEDTNGNTGWISLKLVRI